MYSWLAESLGRTVSIMYVYDCDSSDGIEFYNMEDCTLYSRFSP